jgi:hypothetical protein
MLKLALFLPLAMMLVLQTHIIFKISYKILFFY